MKYTSTRNHALRVDAAQAILGGIAPDGGLYVPVEFPQVQPSEFYGLTYPQTACKVLRLFLTDYDAAFLQNAAEQAYCAQSFTGGEDIVHKVMPGRFSLELWHGPTCAFKDYALQLMPKLLVEAKRMLGDTDETKILVATSGDTGKAALAGYANLPGIKIAVFYPNDGTSEIQRLQMATQEGGNVAVYAVAGNFDDAQTGVKRVFADAQLTQTLAQRHQKLSSANSINWGRLVPQIVYYFYAYAQLVQRGEIADGEKVNFCVPTGNFGDILAGYYAKRMGLPVGKLVCASNKNNVLTDFLCSGEYNARRTFYRTASPSMDILVSSNLERLLYHVTQDDSQVNEWMQQLNREGRYCVSADVLQRIRADFACGYATDEAGAVALCGCWEQNRYLMDTHTAVAWDVAQRTADKDVPCVVLSTASPYKFPCDVLSALRGDAPLDEFEAMAQLEALTGVPAPRSLADLRAKAVRFDTVMAKEDIGAVALQL